MLLKPLDDEDHIAHLQQLFNVGEIKHEAQAIHVLFRGKFWEVHGVHTHIMVSRLTCNK